MAKRKRKQITHPKFKIPKVIERGLNRQCYCCEFSERLADGDIFCSKRQSEQPYRSEDCSDWQLSDNWIISRLLERDLKGEISVADRMVRCCMKNGWDVDDPPEVKEHWKERMFFWLAWKQRFEQEYFVARFSFWDTLTKEYLDGLEQLHKEFSKAMEVEGLELEWNPEDPIFLLPSDPDELNVS